MAAFGHIYTHICTILAPEVFKTYSKCINTQETGAHYTKLTQIFATPTNFYAEGCSANPATLTHR